MTGLIMIFDLNMKISHVLSPLKRIVSEYLCEENKIRPDATGQARKIREIIKQTGRNKTWPSEAHPTVASLLREHSLYPQVLNLTFLL